MTKDANCRWLGVARFRWAMVQCGAVSRVKRCGVGIRHSWGLRGGVFMYHVIFFRKLVVVSLTFNALSSSSPRLTRAGLIAHCPKLMRLLARLGRAWMLHVCLCVRFQVYRTQNCESDSSLGPESASLTYPSIHQAASRNSSQILLDVIHDDILLYLLPARSLAQELCST